VRRGESLRRKSACPAKKRMSCKKVHVLHSSERRGDTRPGGWLRGGREEEEVLCSRSVCSHVCVPLLTHVCGADHVRIPFGNMGVLLCEKRFCSFKFTADGINAPNMIKSIMSQSDFDGRVADPLASFVDSFLVTKKKEDEAKARKKEDEEAKLRAEFEAKAAQAAAALRQSQQRDRRPTANPSPPSPIAQSPQTSTRGPDSSRQPRSLYSREPYNVLKDQFEEKMSSFPFPKFLIPDTKKHAKEPTDVVNKNMEIAYTRLEGTLVLGLERREKETVAAKELKERNFQVSAQEGREC